MFNSGILDVAIGMMFIFLILSLICTALNEIIESLLKMRARDLEKGIRTFLYDQNGTGLAQKLYEHPLIFGLYKGDYSPQKSSNLPSYIPARNFAIALMDLILPAAGTTTSGAAGATVSSPAAAASPAGGGPAAPATPAAPLQPLRDAVAIFPNVQIRQALLPLVDAAGNDLSKARENIEKWYDSATERITGWYKRRTQWIVLVLGLAVAIAVNVDTINVARSLSYDTAMRNSLVAAAQEYAKKTSDKQVSPEERIKENLKEIQKYGLPIGWNTKIEGTIPQNGADWGLRILGWLLTAVAISLGAPFWFDLLNKFMTARSTLKPTKPEEAKP